MKVTYYLFVDPQDETDKHIALGFETHSNINEVLIPDSSKENITVTRYFDGHATHRWIVKAVTFDNSNVSIFLKPRNIAGENFLPQTIKRVKKSAMELLRFGTIVEVDFGFKPKVYKGSNEAQTSAKRYPDVVQHQELYKRRPAIVLKATRRGVQVIPLTSQEPDDYATNGSVFKLSEESLKNCTQLGRDSYVLSHLIQTVGYSRILPPLSRYKSNHSQRLESYRVRINRQDERLLSEALAHNVGLGDYYKNKAALKECEQQLIAFKDECARYETEAASLDDEKDVLEEKLANVSKKHDTLRELLRDQYLRTGTYSQLDVDAGIDNEIAELSELVGA